jgi:hypothetical protein
MDISSLSSISQTYMAAISSNSSSSSDSSSDETELLESATENKIGSYVVSQAVFEEYDTDNDGEISAAEEAAYIVDIAEKTAQQTSDKSETPSAGLSFAPPIDNANSQDSENEETITETGSIFDQQA